MITKHLKSSGFWFFLSSLALLQDEWSGEQKLQYSDIPDDIEPEEIRPLGNYAVEITWPDGFNQVFVLTYFVYVSTL